MEDSPTLNGLRESDIRTELERILRSRAFVHSHRIRRFLQFVVEECLLGQHHRLKEYLIGLEVFNRQEAFDPRVDSIVRVEARRLRTKLEEYYVSEGHEDEIVIQLRKGSYVPVFEHRRPGMGAWPGYGATSSRRNIAIGEMKVFNGSATHEAAMEDVRRRVAHVLIKDGFFQVSGPAHSAADGSPLAVAGTTNGKKPDYVVEGSLYFHADRVTVILQLLSVADGSYIWSEDAECNLDDFSGVDELARGLNRTLIMSAGSTEAARARRHGSDRNAFDQYLQGRYQWKQGTPESIRGSVDLFSKAVDGDPQYAAAWAGLSQALLVSCTFGFVNPVEAAPRIREAAEQAVSLNENLPEAHVARGATLSMLDWDWAAGERELQRAIQLAPADPSAHVAYGLQLACRRMLDAAISEIECALELDPALLFTNFALGWIHSISGRHEDALVHHRLVAQLAPDYPLSYLGLGWAYAGNGLYRDAIAYFTNASHLLRSRTLLSGCLGYCHARANEKEEALRQLLLLDNSHRDGEPGRQLWPVSAAAIYTGLGDKDRALTYLEEAVEARNLCLPLRTLSPEFNSLRGEPRFQALLDKMGIA